MANRIEQAVTKLKIAGVRMTPQRFAILSYLLQSMAHPTADEIYKALEKQFPSMSVATVYNNLKVFLETGLVRELSYGDNSSRFDAEMSDHYHAICSECGKIEDFYYSPIHRVEDEVEKTIGFTAKGLRLEVYGLCTSCASANKTQ